MINLPKYRYPLWAFEMGESYKGLYCKHPMFIGDFVFDDIKRRWVNELDIKVFFNDNGLLEEDIIESYKSSKCYKGGLK